MLAAEPGFGRERGKTQAREDELGGEQDEEREVEAEPSARRRGSPWAYGNGA
jgi:hypothetical protein